MNKSLSSASAVAGGMIFMLISVTLLAINVAVKEGSR
jgi:hypothetical protein